MIHYVPNTTHTVALQAPFWTGRIWTPRTFLIQRTIDWWMEFLGESLLRPPRPHSTTPLRIQAHTSPHHPPNKLNSITSTTPTKTKPKKSTNSKPTSSNNANSTLNSNNKYFNLNNNKLRKLKRSVSVLL